NEMKKKYGFVLREISPGGGFGVRYTTDDPTISAKEMITKVGAIVAAQAKKAGIDPLPEVTIEPGRSMIASSAVALYRVGSVKVIPGVRTYVAIDGGMADNIRPTAYGSKYSVALANRVTDNADSIVAIAGKYCESGDVLARDVSLPTPKIG